MNLKNLLTKFNTKSTVNYRMLSFPLCAVMICGSSCAAAAIDASPSRPACVATDIARSDVSQVYASLRMDGRDLVLQVSVDLLGEAWSHSASPHKPGITLFYSMDRRDLTYLAFTSAKISPTMVLRFANLSRGIHLLAVGIATSRGQLQRREFCLHV